MVMNGTIRSHDAGNTTNIPGLKIRRRPATAGQSGSNYIECGQFSDVGNDSSGTDGNRFIVKNDGNVGIGINSPETSFHVVNPNATNPTWYNQSYLDDSACIMVSENNYNVETVRDYSTHYTTLILSSDHAYDSGHNAAGSVSFAAKNEFGGYSTQYGQISGVRLGSFYGGLSFATMHNLNDGKLREDMRIANGNVGIGTVSPLHKLVVYDGIFGISPSSSTLGLTSELAMYGTFGVNSGTDDTGPRRAADITSGFNSGVWGNEYMAFHVGRNGANNDSRVLTNERVRITGNGNVGIGTTNPNKGNLSVYGLGADPYFTGFSEGDYADATDFTGLAHFHSSGSHGVIRISNSVSKTGTTRIDFNTTLGAYWGTNTPSNSYFRGTAPTAGRIMVSGEIDDNYEDAYMTFHTCRDLRVDGQGGTGNLYERMRITSEGNVGIGVANPKNILHTVSDNHATFSKSSSAGWSGIRLGMPYTTNHDAYCSVIEAYNNPANNYNSELRFKTSNGDNTAATERMRITSGGNVGIGTASPQKKLHVVTPGNDPLRNESSVNPGIEFYNTQGGVGNEKSAQITYKHGNRTTDTDQALQFYNPDSSGSNMSFRFLTSGTASRVVILDNGNVGIGTTNPTLGKLTVIGIGSGNIYNVSYFNRTQTSFNGNQSLGSVSIYGSLGIAAGNYVAASDTRIKDNIIDVDDGSALETLRLLKPKRYTYRDVIGKGEEPVWGFIAQEVRDTLPYATTLLKEAVPNIYELANVSQSNVITFTNFNTSNLESNATTLIRTKGIDGEDRDIHLAEVIDEHTIRVEEDLTEWIGSVDETGNVVAGNQLFIYGQEVDDFVFLKKDAIWTVATSALQEVDRQLQAEKAKVATLETQLASVLTRLDALEGA
jgi:hypothetical protein